jgi:hypothetical protein
VTDASGPVPGEPGLAAGELDDDYADYDDQAADDADIADAAPGEPVPAGRAASGSVRPGASGARSAPRQQPRRSSAAKRRPAGKKKRR